LKILGGNDNDKLTNFSYFQLVTGKTWETYEKELNYKNRVDYKLLDNIGAARKQIIKQFPSVNENDEETKKQYIKITNALLGKIIFVRYLIDRKVKIYFEGESRKRDNKEFCKILKNADRAIQFFNTLADKKVGFNGDLFPITENEYNLIPKQAYKILIRLLKSQEIATRQQSLFDLYDFSIIPTEFISNVYESFVGVEKEKRTKRGKKKKKMTREFIIRHCFLLITYWQKPLRNTYLIVKYLAAKFWIRPVVRACFLWKFCEN
jgi:hypothetical protein